MQHCDTAAQERFSQLHDDLIRAIHTVRQAIDRLHAAPPEHVEALREELRTGQYELWILLAEPLLRVAAGWTRSGPFEELICTRSRRDALEALAMSMYLNIIEAIPAMTIDPEQNVLSYLQTIARRGISREHRQIYQGIQRSSATNGTADHPLPGSPSAAMYPPALPEHTAPGVVSYETSTQVEPVDPASLDMEERILRACHNRQCWQTLREWAHAQSEQNQLILAARWFALPPRSFNAIAPLLGAGWTIAAARQRHHRLLRAAAKFLHSRGLLE